jgi:hypothetical protein
MTNTYTEPVLKIIKLGRPQDPWPDYRTLGIGREHISELIHLLQDDEISLTAALDERNEKEDLPEWYAQIHTWRALGQLHAEEAIPALLGILHQIDDDEDDWLSSEAEDVFAMLGKPAIGPLAQYLADENNPLYARSAASSSLASIGKTHPDERERCIQAIADVLEKYEENDEGLNGFLIGDLAELKAVEQIELIQRAYEADAVDEMINGDIEDVQVELGLLKERLTPARPWSSLPMVFPDELALPSKKAGLQKKEKNKRKQEKKSRRKNRKRK